MNERKSMILLITIMAVSCLVVTGTTISILYKTALKEQRARLMETAQSQARLIEAIARFNAIYIKDFPGGPIPATLSQIIDAHNHCKGFGRTGEFTLSKKEGKNMVFLLRHRHYDKDKPKPVPYESELAEPMRMALSGLSGTIVGLDYRGEKVLAAYEPVSELNLGIVAKIDLSEVREPFIKSGLMGILFTILVVFVGTSLFIRITNPMIKRLEEQSLELKKVNHAMKLEINERKQAEEALLNSERQLAIRNKISDAFLTFSDENVYSEALKIIMGATGSNKGYFGYINENGDLVSPSLTKDIWEQCMIPDKTTVFPRDSWGGLWGKSLIEKKTLCSNDLLSVPEGHIPLSRALAVPIIFQNELIGQVVVANKETDYNQKDRKLLESIVDSIAPILKARLEGDYIETRRRLAEEALRNAHDELERRVEQRTIELVTANEKLRMEIGERKLAEDALKSSREQYRLLIRNLPSIVYIGRTDWSIELFDNKIEFITGYGANEFNFRKVKWSDIIHEEDLEAVKESFTKAMKSDRSYVREYRIHCKSGDIRWIQERGHIVCDSRGMVEYVSGVLFDIDERKKQEEALKKNEKLLQTIFDGITEPLVLLDENLKVNILNSAALKYYQINNHQDLEGLCCYEVLAGKSEPCKGCQIPAMVANRKSGSFERTGMMNPSSLERVTLYNFDEKDHGYSGSLIRILDITKTRLMEREMIHNEKLASIGLMVSCISHEITNPLSAITFNAPILKDYINAMISIVDNYAKDREDFELFRMPYAQFRKDALRIMTNILLSSQRIQATVSDLKKLYSTKKEQIKRWSDLKQVVERVLAVVGIEINQRVKFFEVNIPENLPEIYTDPDAVEQILTNLLVNAAHAVDKAESRVTFDVKLGSSWEEYLIIEVGDNGCGMDKETLSKIFNPFFSTKTPGMGTGLGLHVCQDLVQDLGGRIEVQSEVGKGSAFRVVLSDIERRSARRL